MTTEKKKHKYEVRWVGTGHGCYAEDYCNLLLGETWAVSEAQAINNIRFKTKFPKYDFLGDNWDAGYVEYQMKAVRV